MDNIEKGTVSHQVFAVGKEEARRIIDKVKANHSDEVEFIAELERIYNSK